MAHRGLPQLVLLACVVASVLATISQQPSLVIQATFKRLRLTKTMWQSTQDKKSWTQEDIPTCGVLCQNLERDTNSCKAFAYNKEAKRCVTAGNFTVYPGDEVKEKGVQVYVRLLTDTTIPFAGENCGFIPNIPPQLTAPGTHGATLTAAPTVATLTRPEPASHLLPDMGAGCVRGSRQGAPLLCVWGLARVSCSYMKSLPHCSLNGLG